MIVKARIIRVGNSRGLRIPKSVLEHVRLRDEVELEVGEDYILIRPARRSRDGWDEQFRAMAERGDDVLLDQPLPPTRWDETEWEW